MARDKNLPFAKCAEYCGGGSGGGGADGLSAYEIALEHGFEGTEEEWLESLQGEAGPQGEKGESGYTPQKGVDYWTVDDKKGIKDDINSTLSGEYVKRDAYNTDIQQLQVNVANLNSMVPSLDLAVQQLQGDVGSIETALDSIIAMQNSLIGGDAYWVLQKSLLQLQRMCRKFIRVDRMIF